MRGVAARSFCLLALKRWTGSGPQSARSGRRIFQRASGGERVGVEKSFEPKAVAQRSAAVALRGAGPPVTLRRPEGKQFGRPAGRLQQQQRRRRFRIVEGAGPAGGGPTASIRPPVAGCGTSHRKPAPQSPLRSTRRLPADPSCAASGRRRRRPCGFAADHGLDRRERVPIRA